MAQIKTTVSDDTKRQIDNLTKQWGMSTATYIRLAVKKALATRSVPFKIGNRIPVYDDDETIKKQGLKLSHSDDRAWRNQMAKKITELALKRPVENIKTDNQGHVLNPKDYPDFTNWMING